ncbi:MAG: transposase [Bacteroidota bacterium]
MIRYTSQKQLSIEEFKTPFEAKLDPANRWVKLAQLMPWDELAHIYHATLNAKQGAPAVDARIVIGAMIVKHTQKLDDREAIEYIRENPYVQYFLGLSNYTSEPVFDRATMAVHCLPICATVWGPTSLTR